MEVTTTGSSASGMFASFIGGLAIGYGVALLLAPRSGRETRAILGDYAQSTGEAIGSFTRSAVDSAKGAAQSAGNRVGDFVEDSKDTVRSVQSRATGAGKAAIDEMQKAAAARGVDVRQ